MTNLFSHQKRNHPPHYAESVTLPAQANVKAAQVEAARFKGNELQRHVLQPLPHMKKNQSAAMPITDAITHCLAKDMVPLTTVDQDGLTKLIKMLDPRYKFPGRKTLLSNSAARKLQMILKKAKYFGPAEHLSCIEVLQFILWTTSGLCTANVYELYTYRKIIWGK